MTIINPEVKHQLKVIEVILNNRQTHQNNKIKLCGLRS